MKLGLDSEGRIAVWPDLAIFKSSLRFLFNKVAKLEDEFLAVSKIVIFRIKLALFGATLAQYFSYFLFQYLITLAVNCFTDVIRYEENVIDYSRRLVDKIICSINWRKFCVCFSLQILSSGVNDIKLFWPKW